MPGSSPGMTLKRLAAAIPKRGSAPKDRRRGRREKARRPGARVEVGGKTWQSPLGVRRRLDPPPPLWQIGRRPRRSPAPAPRRCSSSVVEHTLGKGEVESSILSCSTIFFRRNSTRSAIGWRSIPPRLGRFWWNGRIGRLGTSRLRRSMLCTRQRAVPIAGMSASASSRLPPSSRASIWQRWRKCRIGRSMSLSSTPMRAFLAGAVKRGSGRLSGAFTRRIGGRQHRPAPILSATIRGRPARAWAPCNVFQVACDPFQGSNSILSGLIEYVPSELANMLSWDFGDIRYTRPVCRRCVSSTTL